MMHFGMPNATYTYRCAPLANKKSKPRLFLDVLCHSETRHSPAVFSSLAATGLGTRSFGGIFNVSAVGLHN